MSETLKKHIDKFVTISDGEYDRIRSCFKLIDAKKKQNLLTEGNICHSNYFVVKGCLRLFFINEKGVEQTCVEAH